MKTVVWSCVPEDIFYEIVLRLPVKSVCRFRCVSKSWFSVISDPKFSSLHFDYSLAKPRMLLISLPTIICSGINKYCEVVCTVDYAGWGIRRQPQSLVADYHGIIHHYRFVSHPCNSVGGLCLAEYWDKNSVLIYNPSTRESVRFKVPECPIDDIQFCLNKSYLGFDPVEKNHKVLSLWVHQWPPYECFYYVITLEEDVWRSVECKYSRDLFPYSVHICINGVIYYLLEDESSSVNLVGFDVRLEKFTSTYIPLRIPVKGTPSLMECGGCVVVVYKYDKDEHQEIVMAILTADEKWKCEEYSVPRELLPLFWKNYLKGSSLNGELVFVSQQGSNMIKLDCYDLETKHMNKIQVRAPKDRKHIWSNFDCVKVCPHVERLQSLQGLSPAFYRYHRY